MIASTLHTYGFPQQKFDMPTWLCSHTGWRMSRADNIHLHSKTTCFSARLIISVSVVLTPFTHLCQYQNN